MNRLQLQLLWTDDDGMLKLGLTVTSATHAVYHSTYVYPDDLFAFAEELRQFPSETGSEVIFECGSRDPKWHDYLNVRVFTLKPTGHSALEIESHVRREPPVTAECHFFVAGMPADFNRLGAELSTWVQQSTKTLDIEWRDG